MTKRLSWSPVQGWALLALVLGLTLASQPAIAAQCKSARLSGTGSASPALTTAGRFCGTLVADGQKSFAFTFLPGCLVAITLPGEDGTAGTADDVGLIRATLGFQKFPSSGNLKSLQIHARDAQRVPYESDPQGLPSDPAPTCTVTAPGAPLIPTVLTINLDRIEIHTCRQSPCRRGGGHDTGPYPLRQEKAARLVGAIGRLCSPPRARSQGG